jgi:6-phosphogluconolactonase
MFDPAGRYIATADLGIDKVQIFRLNNGGLTLVSEASSPPGSGPRHVAFHPSGRVLYVINELVDTVSVFAYDAATGRLGAEIQNITTEPPGYTGDKSTAEIIVHPSGRFVYGSNRGHNSIVAYRIDPATGRLTMIGHTTQGVNFPRGFNIDPSGTWLYVGNQKGDNISLYRINQSTGELTPTGWSVRSITPVSIEFKSAAAAGTPGMPNTGAGGGAGVEGAFSLLAAVGLGGAALALLARRRAAGRATGEEGQS